MELNLEEQKHQFLDGCRSLIHRDRMDALPDWLCKADFFQAPASMKYHGVYAGFCSCSLDAYEYAKKLAFLSRTSISAESLAIAGVFHDVCKYSIYKTEYRNQKDIWGVTRDPRFCY